MFRKKSSGKSEAKRSNGLPVSCYTKFRLRLVSSNGLPHERFRTTKTQKRNATLKASGESSYAIELLQNAAAVPKPEQFDLAELLRDIAAEATDGSGIDVSLLGPKPLMIMSDRALVRLVVSNGVRNVFEAVAGSTPPDLHPIVITWGETDVDYWVSVSDKGVGSSARSSLLSRSESDEAGTQRLWTGHRAAGRRNARRRAVLQPAAEGGARYEARWER